MPTLTSARPIAMPCSAQDRAPRRDPAAPDLLATPPGGCGRIGAASGTAARVRYGGAGPAQSRVGLLSTEDGDHRL